MNDETCSVANCEKDFYYHILTGGRGGLCSTAPSAPAKVGASCSTPSRNACVLVANIETD